MSLPATTDGPDDTLHVYARDNDVAKISDALARVGDPTKICPNVTDADGTTPLFVASFEGHAEAVLMLLQCGASKDLRAKDGTTPLQIAEARGHTDVVRLLREHPAPVPDDVAMAALKGDEAVVLAWLDGGGHIDAWSASAKTLLMLASSLDAGHERLVLRLLSRGATVQLRSLGAASALALAAGKRVHRLPKPQVAQADIAQQLQLGPCPRRGP